MSAMMLFTMAQVERLTGLSRGTIRRWQEGGVFAPEHPKPLPISGPYRRVFTFRDVVGLRTLAMLRTKHAVDLQEMLKVGDYLSRHNDAPWSSMRFWVVNGHVAFMDPSSDLMVAGGEGQRVIDEVFLGEIACQVERESEAVRARDPESIGRVSRNRNVMSNQWVVAGTRIPTAIIRDFHEAGYDEAAIIAEYPDLTPDDVRRALAHEAALRQSAA